MTGNVTIKHIRAAGFCVKGARNWFRANSLSFETLLAEGYPEETLLATGDALAQQVVERKRLTDG